MSTRVVAIVGSYRKGGATDSVVNAVLEGARSHGAVTQTIRLSEHPLAFCTNCRQCTQTPGETRGRCLQEDDLEQILVAVEAADAVVLASPVNYYNVTALFRQFEERLLGFAYWPWGQKTPVLRSKKQPRKAVLIAAAGMPGFLIPLFTGATRALRLAARMLGARPVGQLWVGLTAGKADYKLPERMIERAWLIGTQLAA